ncbi:hypothetical protein ACLKA6_010103 [Drosophila palustris]
MSKLSSRWVPRLLSAEHKRNRLVIAKESLALLNANKNEFLRRFVIVGVTWIHHHTPESKEQSKQWISTGETAPKKAKIGLSANKGTGCRLALHQSAESVLVPIIRFCISTLLQKCHRQQRILLM